MKLFDMTMIRSFAIGFLIGAAGFGIAVVFDSPAGATDVAATQQHSYPNP